MPEHPLRNFHAALVHACGPLALALLLAAPTGCGGSSRRLATPAAHTLGTPRPLDLLPPFELASPADAVVRITGDVSCTGTLIADDLVLTAHHCLAVRDDHGNVQPRDKAPAEINVELGGDYLPWGDVGVRAIVAPDCGHSAGDGDIAILVLARHLIGMPTLTARIDGLPRMKDGLLLFGFGRCALSRDAVHRVVRESSPITSIAAGHFLADAAVCPGDSGGPVFNSRGDIIGVVSASAMDGDERTRAPSVFARVDVWPQIFSAAHEISLGASPSELPPFADCHFPHAADR